MLEINSVSKSFGNVKVLKNISMFVGTGELHALLGSNGAGKSTLIKVLGGLYPDATGEIKLNGKVLNLSDPGSAIAGGVGIVHQEFDVIPEMTVSENIFLGIERFNQGLCSSINRLAIRQKTSELLKRYSLNINPDTKVGELSVGAQQLVQIAKVLALETDVMIFDEPTARLGQNDRMRLFEVFNTLQQRGKKIVFVTHYLDEVMQVATHATVMRDGCVTAHKKIKDTTISELSFLMVGEAVEPVRKRAIKQYSDVALDISRISSDDNFHDVSFSVKRGEILGVIGHLGSGRHQLIRHLLNSPELTNLVVRSQTNLHSRPGFIPEHRRSEGIFPELSIAENIYLGSLIYKPIFSLTSVNSAKSMASEIVRSLQVKMSGVMQKISELSGGNQQKVIFGRSMVNSPSLYIIESPTVGVDIKAAVELHNEVFKLAEKDMAVIVATDDLDEALLLCDRIIVMYRGRIVKDCPVSDLSRSQLISAMGSA